MSRRLKGEAGVDVSARSDLPGGLVTFLFTDIEGSTRLAQMLGGAYRALLHEHRRVIREAVCREGGFELFTEGDALFVAFTRASSALRACDAAQRALADNSWPSLAVVPRVRMGLHTGHAEPVGGEYASVEVHRAARVSTAAHGGQVLCSAATARLAERERGLPDQFRLLDLGLHRLRGFEGRERLYQLVAPGLQRCFPRVRTDEVPSHNLPASTGRLVGRGRERVELGELLGGERLVTVTGPGGVGKTRLAIEVARELISDFPDGAWVVDLSAAITTAGCDGMASPAELAVAAVLGLRPEPGRALLATLSDYVASRRLLLVLDTCDASVEEARRVVSELLSASGSTVVLATSREPLGAPGEVVWRLSPLSVTSQDPGGRSPAAELLIDLATAARGGRAVSLVEAGDLSRVAAALDGLPLALELAAARLRVLSAAQLAARTGDILRTLDAGVRGDDHLGFRDGEEVENRPVRARHSSMWASMTWSYRTLGKAAARLLRLLSVFVGSVELPAVEWLHDGDPLDPLATLVDKSLLEVDSGPRGATYRMLAPIRDYARHRLSEAKEEPAARERHVAWCLSEIRKLAVGADGRGRGVLPGLRVKPVPAPAPRRPAAGGFSLNSLDPLCEELRAALQWTVTTGSARNGLAIVAALDSWWHERGLVGEGRAWLSRLYRRIDVTGERVPSVELAEAYHQHSLLAGADGDYTEELRFVRLAEDLARDTERMRLTVRVKAGRGAALMGMGRFDEAEAVCKEAMSFARSAGLAGEALPAAYALAELLWRRDDLDAAADLLAATRPIEASSAVARARRTVDLLLGLVALSRRDLVAAHEHLVVALRSRLRHGFNARACEAVSAMAVRCVLGGDAHTAARLFGAAQAARIRLRHPPSRYQAFWAKHHSSARIALGDLAFDTAYAAGAELDLEAAAELALAVEHPDLVLGSCRF